jgi:hypothetical protein
VISGQPARIFVVDLKKYPSAPAINNSKYPDAFPRPGSTKVLENQHVVVWDNVWNPGRHSHALPLSRRGSALSPGWFVEVDFAAG